MNLYKITLADGSPCHGGSGTWDMPNGKPGAWREAAGKLEPCHNGLHLCRVADLSRWLKLDAVVWAAEAGDERVTHDDKLVARSANGAKLTEAQVLELVAIYHATKARGYGGVGGMYARLASEWGVSSNALKSVIAGETWGWLTGLVGNGRYSRTLRARAIAPKLLAGVQNK